LNYFIKATPLCDFVKIGMSSDTPLSVLYEFEEGKLAYHLAPQDVNED